MAAELPHTRNGAASLHFALGCFWAALRLRAEVADDRRLAVDLALACIVGALFIAHAAVPGTHAWPLIWPALGGAVAVLMPVTIRQHRTGFAGIGARLGAASGILFFIGSAVWLWWVGAPDIRGRIEVLGLAAALAIAVCALTAGLAGLCVRNRSGGSGS